MIQGGEDVVSKLNKIETLFEGILLRLDNIERSTRLNLRHTKEAVCYIIRLKNFVGDSLKTIKENFQVLIESILNIQPRKIKMLTV